MLSVCVWRFNKQKGRAHTSAGLPKLRSLLERGRLLRRVRVPDRRQLGILNVVLGARNFVRASMRVELLHRLHDEGARRRQLRVQNVGLVRDELVLPRGASGRRRRELHPLLAAVTRPGKHTPCFITFPILHNPVKKKQRMRNEIITSS